MTTIKDVAQKAGVSTATVSRVINEPLTVSSEAKARVSEAIKELNYQPNYLGRNLRRSETKMIMILLQNIANPFYSRVVQGMEDQGLLHGYNTMIFNTNSDPDREKTYLQLLQNRLADGVILMEPEIAGVKLAEIGSNFPVVQCCEYIKEAGISYVAIDNIKAAYTAVKHLLDLGHKRIGMISGYNHLLSAIQREKGYQQALRDAKIKFNEQLIKYGSYGFKGGMRAAREFLCLKKRPTAIFAISDIMAIAALKVIKDAGLKVPNDIAVVGFDNTSISEMYDPPITTIAQPRYQLGKTAIQLLLAKIKGKEVDQREIFLDHELIVRESTGEVKS